MFAAKANTVYKVDWRQRQSEEVRKREGVVLSSELCLAVIIQWSLIMKLTVKYLHDAFLPSLLSGRRNTSQQALRPVLHVLLHCAEIIRVCSH